MRVSEAHDYDLVGGLTDESFEQEPAAPPPNPFRILAAERPQMAPLSR